MILTASKREESLFMLQMEEFIGIQSYALLLRRMSVIRFFKLCYKDQNILFTVCFVAEVGDDMLG
jgi:hypothetical protein